MNELLIHEGTQLAVDCTLVSLLKRNEDPRSEAYEHNEQAPADARKRKQRRYPELCQSTRCTLVVTGMEVGGRWDEGAYEFLLELAEAKAQQAPQVLRGSGTRAWRKRWVALLSKAAMDSFASILVHGTAENTEFWNGPPPALGAVFCSTPEPPAVSRLGLR